MNIEPIELANFDDFQVEKLAKKMDSVFRYNKSIEKTSYLNWRMEIDSSHRSQFIVIGNAFFSTAYNLVQQCIIDNTDKKADSWIFPILFNTVHGIEVYLKAINVSLNIVLAKDHTKIEGGHDIKQLCSIAKSLIGEYKAKHKNTTSAKMLIAIRVVENFIENIYAKTGDMTFARYPVAKDKSGHFYIQKFENEVVDLELLQEQLLTVFNMLQFIYAAPELEIERNTEITEK